MSNTTIKIDAEFKALIPPSSDEERAGLEAAIRADGCRDPLVTWNGVLIDGHNRHEICERLGIEYSTASIDLLDRDAALIWIIDNQRGRRNIAEIDRIALEHERDKILERKASAAMKSGKGADGSGGRGNKINPLAILPKGLHTRRECAKSAGVGERTYDAGKMILKAVAEGKVKPEVVEDIRRGRAAIHRVAKDLKEKHQRNARQEKRIAAAKSAPEFDERIIVGDFRQHADKVADGSVSLIFTDPPYDREASKMLPALAEFAAAKLADGGSLICYVGQTQLPAAIEAFGKTLRYWWTIACVHAGRSTVMREYGINAGWKAVLWFVKGTRDDNSVMVSDVMSGGQEKQMHDWQQSQSEAEYWIAKLCPHNGLVCDPFLGSGTTAAAANGLKLKWIGFERDETTAKIAAERVTR